MAAGGAHVDRHDHRVSSVLTATRTPGRASENAEAGMPPWFAPDQRHLVEEIAQRS